MTIEDFALIKGIDYIKVTKEHILATIDRLETETYICLALADILCEFDGEMFDWRHIRSAEACIHPLLAEYGIEKDGSWEYIGTGLRYDLSRKEWLQIIANKWRDDE